ncbi:MAG: rRNA maturation RNase YbeY [Patescibacteria group bacterium]|nr:rRNA maturation RNase YbeY [Patescibacteria group bacterium]MDD4304105.1 rRNA maturation RNase YbeY [Patescibacteria group bacterium]MDD4694982.1 rRNA maturation RNase YbeY [Patescibacteria group bacterium]
MKDNINIIIKGFRFNRWMESIVGQIEKNQKIKEDEWSIVITNDKEIRKLNKKYRKKNKTTDVLSFAECDINQNFVSEKKYLGEVIINYEQAKRQAKNLKKEMLYLLVHGYLHLKSYTHENDKDEMIMNKEADKIIQKIKL